MTELQRIEFAAAAMACKRMGLLSHTTASRDGREQPGKCVPGRVRHQFRDSPVCVHCGARKGSRSGDGQSPVPQHNRLKDLDLS